MACHRGSLRTDGRVARWRVPDRRPTQLVVQDANDSVQVGVIYVWGPNGPGYTLFTYGLFLGAALPLRPPARERKP